MLSLSVTFISAVGLLTFVFILSLLFIGGENIIFHIQGGGEHFLDPLERILHKGYKTLLKGTVPIARQKRNKSAL